MENVCQEIKNKPFQSRYGKVLKTISAALVICFFLQDFVHAQGGEALWTTVIDARTAKSSSDSTQLFKRNIAVPSESGQIRRVAANGQSDIIINIQDAHSKLGAQESITKILDTLVRNYDLNLISLEAASGTVDTALVSSFPLEEARRKTAQYFMSEGKISAGEFYSMVAKEPVKLFGAEDPTLYSENLDAFKELVDAKPALRAEMEHLARAISELGKRVYAAELVEMQNKKLLHRSGGIKFTEYWDYFSRLAEARGVTLDKYPNLKKLSETVGIEKFIDFKKATSERDALIEELRSKLPTQDLQQLVLLILQFKQNKITPGAFHYELSRLAQGHDIDPAKNKNIILYSQYVVLYENIDLVAIFDEVESFERELKEKMFVNADERELSDIERASSILMKLLDTSLSSKDYEFYTAHLDACEIDSIQNKIQALETRYGTDGSASVDFGLLKKSIPDAQKFYELASRRNQVLLKNTLLRMQKENVHVAALITGGFHSEGISELMDQEKLSYLVIMPKFDEKSPDRPYLAVITKKPKEFEAQFKDTEFYIAAGTFADIDGIAKATYGAEAQREFLEAGFAALMVSARLVAASDASSPEFQDSFLNNYKQRGGTLIDEATLRGWLESLVIKRTGGDAYQADFGGRTYRVGVQNGAITSAEKTTGGVTMTVKASDLALMRENLDKMSRELQRIEATAQIEPDAALEAELTAAVGSRLASGEDPQEALAKIARRKNLNLSKTAQERIISKAQEAAGARLAKQKTPAPLVALEDLKPNMQVMQKLKPRLSQFLNPSGKTPDRRAIAKEVAATDVHSIVAEAQSWNAYDIITNPHLTLLLNICKLASARKKEEYNAVRKEVKWPSEQYQEQFFDALSQWMGLEDSRTLFDLAVRERGASFENAKETVKPEETVKAPKDVPEWEERQLASSPMSKAPAKTVPMASAAKPVKDYSKLRAAAVDRTDDTHLSIILQKGTVNVGFMVKKDGAEKFQQLLPDTLVLPLKDGTLPPSIVSPPTGARYQLELDEAAGVILFVPIQTPGQLVVEQNGTAVPVSTDNSFTMALPAGWESAVETEKTKRTKKEAQEQEAERQAKLGDELRAAAINLFTDPALDSKAIKGKVIELKKLAADRRFADKQKFGVFLDRMMAHRVVEEALWVSFEHKWKDDPKAADFDAASPDDVLKHVVERNWTQTLEILTDYEMGVGSKKAYRSFYLVKSQQLKANLIDRRIKAEAKLWALLLDSKISYVDAVNQLKVFYPLELSRLYFQRIPLSLKQSVNLLLAVRKNVDALDAKFADRQSVEDNRLNTDVFDTEWDALRQSPEVTALAGILDVTKFCDESRAASRQKMQKVLDEIKKDQEAKSVPKIAVAGLEIAYDDNKMVVVRLPQDGVSLNVTVTKKGKPLTAPVRSFSIHNFNQGDTFKVSGNGYEYQCQLDLAKGLLVLTPMTANRFSAVDKDSVTGKVRPLGGATDGRIELTLSEDQVKKWRQLARVAGLPGTSYGQLLYKSSTDQLPSIYDQFVEFATAVDEMRGYAQEIRNGKHLDRKGLENLREADALLKEIRKDLEEAAAKWGSDKTDIRLGQIYSKFLKLKGIVEKSGILSDSIARQAELSNNISLQQFAKRAAAMLDRFTLFQSNLAMTPLTNVRDFRDSADSEARNAANAYQNTGGAFDAELQAIADKIKNAATADDFRAAKTDLDTLIPTIDAAMTAAETDNNDEDVDRFEEALNEANMLYDPLVNVIEADGIVETLDASVAPVMTLPTAAQLEEDKAKAPPTAVQQMISRMRPTSLQARGWARAILLSLVFCFGAASYLVVASFSSPRKDVAAPVPVVKVVEKDSGVKLRFPDSGFNVPLEVALPGEAGAGQWVPGGYKLQIAAADTLELAGIVNAEAGRKGNYSAEVPQFARDQFNVPLLVRMVDGEPCLVRQDGTTVPVSNPAILASLDTTGKVMSNPANPFVAVDVAGTFDFGIKGRTPQVALKPGKAAPLGLNGQPVTAQAKFRTVQEHRKIHLGFRAGDGSRRMPMPGSAETRGPLQPYNVETGNRILVFDTVTDLNRDTRNLELLRNRVALAKSLKDNPKNLVAVSVSDDHTVDKEFKNFNNIPPLVFFLRQANGTVKQYLPTDLTVDQSKEPSEIRVLMVDAKGNPLKNPDGTFQAGNRVEFTALGDRELLTAQAARERAFVRSVGNWAVTASTGISAEVKTKKAARAHAPVTLKEIVATTKPLYAILVRRNPQTNEIFEYYELPTIECVTANTTIVRTSSGLPPQFVSPAAVNILKMVPASSLKSVLEAEATSKAIGGGYEIITSHDSAFQRLVMIHESAQVDNADVMAVIHFMDQRTGLPLLDAQGQPQTQTLHYSDKAEVAHLQRLRRTAKIRHDAVVPVFESKDGRTPCFVEMNTDVRMLAVQVSSDLRQETREFWSNDFRDVQELARLKGHAHNKNKGEMGFQVDEPNAASDKTWVIYKRYGYEVKEDGTVTSYDDPLKMSDRLRARDAQGQEHAHRFQYVLANGTIVRWNQLRPTDIVVELRDPETQSRIFTGSNWELWRLQYELRTALGNAHAMGPTPHAIVESLASIEQKMLLGQIQGQMPPAVGRMRGMARANQAIDMMKKSLGSGQSIDPSVAAAVQAEIDLVQKRFSALYDATLARTDLNRREKERMLANIESLCHQVQEQNMAVVNGTLILVEPSVSQVVWRASQSKARVERQMDYENLLGPGGLVVSTNGDAMNRSAVLLQINQAAGGTDKEIAVPKGLGFNDVHEAQAYKRNFERISNRLEKDLDKNPSQTRLEFQDPNAPNPVLNIAKTESETYREKMRLGLEAAQKKLETAKFEFENPDPNKGGPAPRDNRKNNSKEWNEKINAYINAWIEAETLRLRLRDAETEDPSAFRRQVYVREVKNKKGAVVGTEQVAIVTSTEKADEYLARREAIAKTRENIRTAIIEAMEKGGMRVSVIEHPEKSAVHVRQNDPAKNHPEFARVEGVMRQKLAELEAFYEQLGSADRQGKDTVQIINQIVALETEFQNSTFVHVLPNGNVEVIELFGGLEEAQRNFDNAQSFGRDATFGAQDALNGRVVEVNQATKKGVVVRDVAKIQMHQEKLAHVLSEANEEYLQLCAQRAANPAPNPVRDGRIAELAQQLRQRYYDENGNRYYINAGYVDALAQLNQIRQNLELQVGPGETVLDWRDEQGVFTGGFEVRRNVGGIEKTVKRAMPLAADDKGRPRFEVHDLERDVQEVVTLGTYVRPGETTLRTREVERTINILGKNTDPKIVDSKVIKKSLHTASSPEFLPESGIPLKSTTMIRVSRDNQPLQDDAVFKERTVVKNARGDVQRVRGFVLLRDAYGPGSSELKDQVRFVAMDPATGEEAITFYPKEDGKGGEAMVTTSRGNWDVFDYTVQPDGGFELGAKKTGTVSDTGKMFGNARIYARKDADGRDKRAFAVDPRGMETISFYYRSRALPNGTLVTGEAVMEMPQTAGKMFSESTRKNLHILDNAVVSAVLYFDENFKLYDSDGKGVTPAAENIPALGLTTGCNMKIANYPADIYPGETAPKQMRVVPRLDANQKFIEARVVDGQGHERAIVTQDALNPAQYYIDFLTPNLDVAAKNGSPIRVTHTARKTVDGVLTIDSRILSTTFMYEADFDKPEDAFWIIEGGPTVPASAAELIRQIPASQHAQAKEDLKRSLDEIRKTAGLEKGKLTLQLTAEQRVEGGQSFRVGVKQDPFGRLVAALNSTYNPNVTINTKWNGEYPVEGQELVSNGINMVVRGQGVPVKASTFVGLGAAGKEGVAGAAKYMLPADKYALLGLDASAELIPIDRNMLVNGKEVYRDTLYLLKGDRFVRLVAAAGSDGNVRFVCWGMPSKAPIGIAPGEVVYNIREGRIIRETLFHEHRKDAKEYVYRVTGPTQGPEALRNPDLIFVNYASGPTIGEVRGVTVDEKTGQYISKHALYPTVQVFRNDFPLYTYQFQDTNFTRDAENLKHYSYFRTYIWTDAKGDYHDIVDSDQVQGKAGDIYTVITEVIGKAGNSPSDRLPEIHGSGLVTLVYRNGRLIARIEGTIIGTAMVYTDNAEGLKSDTGLSERFNNNVFNSTAKNAPLRRLIEGIQEEKTNEITPQNLAAEIPYEPARDWVIYGMKLAIQIAGGFFVFMSVFAGIWRWLHQGKKPKADMASDFDQDLLSGEGTSGARLSSGAVHWTPGQRLVMFNAVSNRTKIPDNVPEEERPKFIKEYFMGQGFSEDEATLLSKSKKHQKQFMGTDFISRELPVAPPLNLDILDADDFEKSFVDLLQVQVSKNYPPALVLYSLLENKSLTQSQMADILLYTLHSRKKKGAAAWDFMMKRAVAQVQARALNKLRFKSISGQDKMNIIRNLPPTKEANTLRYMLQKRIITPKAFLDFVAQDDSPNFVECMQRLLEKLVVKPEFDRLFEQTYRGKMNDQTRDRIFQSISSQILPFIFETPALLNSLKSGSTDILYNPYPMVSSVDSASLSELILAKCLQANYSETNPTKDGRMLSAGALSNMWPMVIYLARRMNEAIKSGSTPDDVLGIVDQHVSLMSSALLHDLPRYRAVTERWHWNGTPEKQVMESVEAALRKILNVSDQAAIDAQLKAVTAALYGRVGADKVVSRIRTEIRNGTLTEEKLSSVLEMVQMSLGNEDIRDLFMDFQIWNIYEFTLLEEDKAKAGGEKPLSLEEQIERFTGKSRSIDAMRNTMKSGTADQKITLAGDLNKTSKALMGLHFPEVVKLEENKGIGIRNFYNSYIRPLFSVLSSAMAPALGMSKTGKIVYGVTALSVAATGAAVIFLYPTYLALGVFMIVGSVAILPMFFMNAPIRAKFFWAIIHAASTAYVYGNLIYFLFGSASGIRFEPGLFFTLILLVLTTPVTWQSFKHYGFAIKSFFTMHSDTWSKTYRSLTGLDSLNPFSGLFGALFSIRSETNQMPLRAFVRNAVSKTGVLYTVIGYTLYFTAPAFAGYFTIGTGVVLLGIILSRWLMPKFDIAEFWENKFTRWFNEFQTFEEEKGALLSNGESVSEYFERLVNLLYEKYLLDDFERDNWLRALKGDPDGRFVRPGSVQGFQSLYYAFSALSQNRPVADPHAVLQASSTHVQAGGGEIMTHTYMNSMAPGTFHDKKIGGRTVKTSILGYLAQNMKPEWKNFYERLVDDNSSPEMQEAAERLAGMREEDALLDLLAQSGLSEEETRFVIGRLVAWLNEMRPTNSAVASSMARDFSEMHLVFANEAGTTNDMRYYSAVRNISMRYDSLNDAYDDLRTEVDLTPVDEQSTDEFLEKELFVKNFKKYDAMVSRKLRGIFHDPGVWNDIESKTGGADVKKVGSIDGNIVPKLEAYRTKLSSDDPILQEVQWLLDEMKTFSPTYATGPIGRFATVQKWSEEFAAWYQDNEMRVSALMTFISSNPDKEWLDCAAVNEAINKLVQSAAFVDKGRRSGLVVPIHEKSDEILSGFRSSGAKHMQIAMNLNSYYGRTVQYDAHVMVEYGQNALRTQWATLNSQIRNPQYAAVNTNMIIWASGNAYPATKNYAIAQMAWTGDVQRALRGSSQQPSASWLRSANTPGALLDYGKYTGIPQTIGIFSSPGEDSAGLLMLQRMAERYGVFYQGTQIDWFTYRWGRPSLLSESIAVTEMRYAFNVTRFVADSSTLAALHNPNVPADVKMSHLYLWNHYFIAPFAILLLLLLPALSPVSAFAFLNPFTQWVIASFALTQAINAFNFLRHWRTSTNIYQAGFKSLFDIMVAIPFYVSTMPFFFLGVWMASNQMFKFYPTVKNAFLGSYSDEQKFKERFVTRFFFGRYGFPLVPIIGLIGGALFLTAITIMTPLGPVILIFYFLASLSFISGFYSFAIFQNAEGALQGYRYNPIFVLKASAYVAKQSFLHMLRSLPSTRQKLQANAFETGVLAGLQPTEMPESVYPKIPYHTDEMLYLNIGNLISSREKAIARSRKAAEGLGLAPDDFLNTSGMTTKEINDWSVSKEIQKQIVDGNRTDTMYSLAGARLARANTPVLVTAESRMSFWKKAAMGITAFMALFVQQAKSQEPLTEEQKAKVAPLVRFEEKNVDSRELPLSFRVPRGYFDSAEYKTVRENVIEELLLQHGVNTYDLFHRRLLMARMGHWDDVHRVNRMLANQRWGDVRGIRAYNAPFRYGDKMVELPASQAFYFRTLTSSYNLDNLRYPEGDRRRTHVKGFPNNDRLHMEDYVPAMGESASEILTSAQMARIENPTRPVSLDSPLLANSFELLTAMETMQSPIGAVYHVPHGTFGKDPYSISTENNETLLAGLEMLLTLVEENQGEKATTYAKRIRRLLYGEKDEKYGAEFAGHRGIISYFLNEAYDKKGRIFYQGGVYKNGRFTPSTDFAADVETWGILALGPSRIDRHLGVGAAYELWNQTRLRSGYFDTKDSSRILGIGFTTGHDVSSVEWTAGGIFAVTELAAYYLKDSRYAAQVEQLVKDALSMREGIESMRVDLEDGSAAYLYANKRNAIPFGWNANPIPSLAGTTWVIYLNINFDPFILGGKGANLPQLRQEAQPAQQEAQPKQEVKPQGQAPAKEAAKPAVEAPRLKAPAPAVQTRPAVAKEWTNFDIIVYGGLFGLAATGLVAIILMRYGQKLKKESDARNNQFHLRMRTERANKNIAAGDRAASVALETSLAKARHEYILALNQYKLLKKDTGMDVEKLIAPIKKKIAAVDKKIEALRKGTSGARLAQAALPSGLVIGFLGQADDAALRSRAEAVISRSATEGVTFQIFESPAAAARANVSLLVDGSATDTLDAQAQVIRAIRTLNDARLEAVYGALTKLVVLVTTKDFYGTSEAEYRQALNSIIDAVHLPAAGAASLDLIESQGRAVLWNAETAGQFAAAISGAATQDQASLGALKELLSAASLALQNTDSAQAIADQMASEPKFWQAAFGVDQQAMLTESSDAKGGIVFTLTQYLKDKARFKEAISQGLFASIVMTEAERTSTKGIEATMEIDESRILFVKDRALSTIQDEYAKLARTQEIPETFVLAASAEEIGEEGVHVDAQARLTGDSRAVVMAVEANATSSKGMVEAARILLGDWQDKGVMPKFLQSMGNGLFKFLPKAAPIELAAWMSAVKKQLIAAGSSA